MNLDDPSVLSAYLDGELAPEDRLALEAELSVDSRLAERLRALSATHELLAGLPRPRLPFDLSATVVSQLEASSPRAGRPLVSLRRRPMLRGAGLVAAAAVLLLALTIGLQPDRGARRPSPANGPRESVARIAPAAPVPNSASGAQPGTMVASEASSPTAPGPVEPVAAREPLEAERRAEADRLKIRGLLDSPDLRRVFIVTDTIGGHALDRVDDLVQKTPRAEAVFGRITVSQGIFIDPAHPNEATVYALVMDDRELRQFQETLAETFPGAVEETDPDPAQITQLADLGQVSVRSGLSVADVFIPRDLPTRSAKREAATPGALTRSVIEGGPELPLGFRGPVVEEDRPEVVDREVPTPEQEASGPGRDRSRTEIAAASSERPGPALPGGRAQPAPVARGRDRLKIEGIPNHGAVDLELAAAKDSGHRNIVLVWVTTSTPSRLR